MTTAGCASPLPTLDDGGSGTTTAGTEADISSSSPEFTSIAPDTTDATSSMTAGPIEQLWCTDADGDGFGDPAACTLTDERPNGTVDNDADCDDADSDTFPGAAESDDPEACMQDEDGDGWGDEKPRPGVAVGTDCDDVNSSTFPGAAENEERPDLCMRDGDLDGWGDANPIGGGDGLLSGSDCYDANPALNPDTVRLTTFLPYQGSAVAPRSISVVEIDASLEDFVLLLTPGGNVPNVNISSATVNEAMEIFATDLTSVSLHEVFYEGTCNAGSGVIAAMGMTYGPAGDIVCGVEFGNEGQLLGIGHTGDNLRTFDITTGEVISSVPLTLGMGLLDVFSCGMARDCTEGRLLLANGIERTIYGIDESTGEATVLRDLSAFFPTTWSPAGLEYDPVTRTALLSIGTELYRIDLTDESVDPELLGGFGTQVSNLQYLPVCM